MRSSEKQCARKQVIHAVERRGEEIERSKTDRQRCTSVQVSKG